MLGELAKCENCGTEFETKRRRHRFCKAACRYEHYTRTHPRLETGKPFRLEVAASGRLVIVQDEPGENLTAK
jgi:hypothetical protein